MAKSLYRLRVPHSLVDLIRSLHPQLKRKLRASLRRIVAEPSTGKALRDELEGLWSYRVSRFRVIYRVSPRLKIVELVAIGPRARIYEETLRLIKREEKKGD